MTSTLPERTTSKQEKMHNPIKFIQINVNNFLDGIHLFDDHESSRDQNRCTTVSHGTTQTDVSKNTRLSYFYRRSRLYVKWEGTAPRHGVHSKGTSANYGAHRDEDWTDGKENKVIQGMEMAPVRDTNFYCFEWILLWISNQIKGRKECSCDQPDTSDQE